MLVLFLDENKQESGAPSILPHLSCTLHNKDPADHFFTRPLFFFKKSSQPLYFPDIEESPLV